MNRKNTADFSPHSQSLTSTPSPSASPVPRQAKPKTSLTHQKTSSSNKNKQPSEYAIQLIFAEFIKVAETVLARIMTTDIDADIDLSEYLRKGANENFDLILDTLGVVAKHRPRIVIDAVMLWRKSKSDPVDPNEIKDHYKGVITPQKIKELQTNLRERQMLAANFIMCRCLIEIVKRLADNDLPKELGNNLEEMVFGQLKAADPESFNDSANRIRNVDLFAELLGHLSSIRFQSVTERYFRDIENTNAIQKDSKLEVLIRSMRFIHLKIYPQEDLDQTVEFFQELSDSFKDAHSTGIKHAFCESITELLTPLGGLVTAEVNIPVWMKSVDAIFQKAMKMMSKQRNVYVALPLATTMILISKRDFFLSKWVSVLEMLFSRLKDKTHKQVLMDCVERLIWTYIFRCSEAITVTQKKLDFFIKQMFPPGKKYIIPSEVPFDYFVSIIRYITLRHLDYSIKNIIFYLFSLDSPLSSYDQLSPERVMIALKVFAAILDSEENEVPKFPWAGLRSPAGDSASDKENQSKEAKAKKGPTLERKLKDAVEKISSFLGKVIRVLDNQFGSVLLVDEKMFGRFSTLSFASTISATAGTAYSNTMSDISSILSKDKQPYYDLMKTWMQLYPRLEPTDIGEREVVELLCKYILHADPDISAEAQSALLRFQEKYPKKQSILLQCLSSILLSVSDKFPELVERMIVFYVQVSTNWIHSAKNTKTTAKNDEEWECMLLGENYKTISGSSVESSNASLYLWSRLQEFESIGLLFLLSSLPSIRKLAIGILRLSEEIYTFFISSKTGRTNDTCLFSVLKRIGRKVLSHNLEDYTNVLSVYLDRQDDPDFIENVASSSSASDQHVWSKIFPYVLTELFATCASTMDTTFGMVSPRFLGLHPHVLAASDPNKTQNNTLTTKWALRQVMPATDEMIEQWKSYLVFICCSIINSDPAWKKNQKKRIITPTGGGILTSTLLSSGGSSPIPPNATLSSNNQTNAANNSGVDFSSLSFISTASSSSSNGNNSRISCAQEIIQMVLPLLSSDKQNIRQAVVVALGNINKIVFNDLIEELKPGIQQVIEDMRSRYMRGSVRRIKKIERIRAELTQILFISASEYIEFASKGKMRDFLNSNILTFMISYIREMGAFLSDNEVQLEWDHQMLRYYFCGLVQNVYEGMMSVVRDAKVVAEVFPFELRFSIFKLLEEWCGYGIRGSLMREREAKMVVTVLEQVKDVRERGSLTSAMEEQRMALEFAALKSMATLLKGSVFADSSAALEKSPVPGFALPAIFEWIQSIFSGNEEPRLDRIAQVALESLLFYNQGVADIWEDVVSFCYHGLPTLSVTKCYFNAVCEVLLRCITLNPSLLERNDLPRTIVLFLFKLADPLVETRMRAHQLLRYIEKTINSNGTLSRPGEKNTEVALLSPSSTVYKKAQANIARHFATAHNGMLHQIVSQIWFRLKNVENNVVLQDLLNILPPWLENMELKIESSTVVNPSMESQLSSLLLWNLVYFTIRFEQEAPLDIEKIWTTISAKKHNLLQIIHFIFQLGLEKRNGAVFATIGRKIVSFIGRDENTKTSLRDILIAELTPKSMIPIVRKGHDNNGELAATPDLHASSLKKFPNAANYYFVAPLEELIRDTNATSSKKMAVLSKGQLIIMLLVDFTIESGGDVLKMALPVLLHSIFVQLDHFNQLSRDHARLLLRSLVHSLGRIRDPALIERLKKPLVATGQSNIIVNKFPSELEEILKSVLLEFDLDCWNGSSLKSEWSEKAIKWATSCPVRHVACRSLQLFQIMEPKLTVKIMADVLARLSNTISDQNKDVQMFSVEIMKTIRVALDLKLEQNKDEIIDMIVSSIMYSMQSCSKDEFKECCLLLLKCLETLNGSFYELFIHFQRKDDSEIAKFVGVQNMLIKGFLWEETETLCLTLFEKMITTNLDRNADRIGYYKFLDNNGNKSRFFRLLLALSPWLLELDGEEQQAKWGSLIKAYLESNFSPADTIHEDTGFFDGLIKLFDAFSKNRVRSKEEFIKQLLLLINGGSNSAQFLQTVTFCLSFLTNTRETFKENVIKILKTYAGLIAPSLKNNKEEKLNLPYNLFVPVLQLLKLDNDESNMNICHTGLDILDDLIAVSDNKNDSSVKLLMSSKLLNKLKQELADGLVEDAIFSKINVNPFEWNEYYMRNLREILGEMLQDFVFRIKKNGQWSKKKQNVPLNQEEDTMNAFQGMSSSHYFLDEVMQELDELEDYFEVDDVSEQANLLTENGSLSSDSIEMFDDTLGNHEEVYESEESDEEQNGEAFQFEKLIRPTEETVEEEDSRGLKESIGDVENVMKMLPSPVMDDSLEKSEEKDVVASNFKLMSILRKLYNLMRKTLMKGTTDWLTESIVRLIKVVKKCISWLDQIEQKDITTSDVNYTLDTLESLFNDIEIFISNHMSDAKHSRSKSASGSYNQATPSKQPVTRLRSKSSDDTPLGLLRKVEYKQSVIKFLENCALIFSNLCSDVSLSKEITFLLMDECRISALEIDEIVASMNVLQKEEVNTAENVSREDTESATAFLLDMLSGDASPEKRSIE